MIEKRDRLLDSEICEKGPGWSDEASETTSAFRMSSSCLDWKRGDYGFRTIFGYSVQSKNYTVISPLSQQDD